MSSYTHVQIIFLLYMNILENIESTAFQAESKLF